MMSIKWIGLTIFIETGTQPNYEATNEKEKSIIPDIEKVFFPVFERKFVFGDFWS